VRRVALAGFLALLFAFGLTAGGVASPPPWAHCKRPGCQSTSSTSSTTTFSTSSTTTSSTTTGPPPPPSSAASFGVSQGSTDFSLSDANLALERDGYQQIHAAWDRFDIYWASIEKTKGLYDWSSADRLVAADRARGIQIIATIAYTPTWARPASCTGSDKCAPANVSDYANFAYAAAAHYSAIGVHVFEVWNEPNIHAFWQPTPSAAAYTALLNAAYPRIKQADPTATVISGGLSPQGGYNDADCNGAPDGGVTSNGSTNPVNFLQGMYAASARGGFDELGFHPYGDSSDLGRCNAWAQMDSTSPSLRSLMGAYGDNGKPVDATEYGNCTCWSGVSEQVQADRLAVAFGKWRTYPWAGILAWFDYHDGSGGLSGWGLTRSDWSRKPAWYAFQAAVP
jgi:polysaccharide biosynthesis protein PslG